MRGSVQVNPLALLPLTASVVVAALGTSVLVRQLRRAENQLYFAFCLSLSAWTLAGFILFHQITQERALFWARLLQYGIVLAPLLFLHLVVVLFDVGRRRQLVPAYLAAGCLMVANHLGLLVEGVSRVDYSDSLVQWYAIRAQWHGLLIAYALIVISTLIAILFQIGRTSSGRRRAQARYLLVAVALASAGGFHDYFGVAGIQTYPTTAVPLYPIGSLAMVIWAAIPGYTLHRRRLLDIDVAVARSFVSILVLALLLMTCFSGLLDAQRAYFGRVDTEFSLIALGALLASTFLFPRLRVVTRESIDNLLFGSQKDYEGSLYALSRESTSMIDLNKLLESVCNTLAATPGVSAAATYVDDGQARFRLGAWRGATAPLLEVLEEGDSLLTLIEKTKLPVIREELELDAASQPELRPAALRMIELGVEAMVPLYTTDVFVGAILLGPKETGGIFTNEDVQRLVILANHISVAVLNARLYSDLTRSREIIQQSDRLSAIGTMAAVLAHELRNPLVSIRTFTQLLPERYDDEEFRSTFLDLTLSEVDRISALINELLAFARPAPADLAEMDVNECVQRISRLLQTQAKAKGVTLAIDLGEQLSEVVADEDQVKQVVLNIVMNAIESCQEGGRVQVGSSETFTQGTEYVRVDVSDTGCGISDENLARIFDPFFTTRKEGTGLGLAIAHQIVTKHGGFIEVDSRIDEGTSVKIHFPVDAPPLTAQMTRLEPPEPGIHG